MRRLVPLFILLGLCGAAIAADPPGRYLADARGRAHAWNANLAQVRNWRDGADCVSTFELVREGAAPGRWQLDWRRVRNVQISTRKHFNEDVEQTAYHQQPGIILYGRNTSSVALPDGTRAQRDNMEFFLKDVTQMDYAFNGLKAYAAACRRL